MQCLSLDCLWELITEGAFMPPQSEGFPELSRTTVILLVFQVDSQHKEITDVYVGLVVHRVESNLQFSNDDPKEHSNYARSCLILPCRAQYNNWLFPSILKPRNHHGLLINSTMGEPYPMEMVGDFRATDLIFKGCYGDSLLYSDADLCQLRWQRIHLPAFHGEVPMPPAPPTGKSGSPW